MQPLPVRVTLALQVEKLLRDEIRGGRWPGQLPGEQALCQQFQVSRKTVRKALAALEGQGLLGASQGRRRRVIGARRPASRTRARARRVMVVAGMPLPLMGNLMMYGIDHMREQLAREGFEVELSVSPSFLARRPHAALESLALEKDVAAWVPFSATSMTQRWFMARRLPCVLAGSCHAGIDLPAVETDHRALGQHAAQQFLAKRHYRLALVLPAYDMAGDMMTAEGFQTACAAAAGAQCRIVRHDGTPQGLRNTLERLLRPPSPTALLVAGAKHALAVMTYCNISGLRVPRDLSVISRDSEPTLDFVLPALTRYDLNVREFGRRLTRAVLALIRTGAARPYRQTLVPKFVRGETVMLAPRG